MSCGCTVISTPIPHAVEMLSDDTGILLTKLMTLTNLEAILCENKEQRVTMGKNAFRQSGTSWENIAIQYELLFDQLTNKEGDLNFCFPPN
jgi:glycosyltransferase involved in cell wall biosynthesis